MNQKVCHPLVLQHDDEVTALATHPGGALVASGQQGERPVVHLW